MLGELCFSYYLCVELMNSFSPLKKKKLNFISWNKSNCFAGETQEHSEVCCCLFHGIG